MRTFLDRAVDAGRLLRLGKKPNVEMDEADADALAAVAVDMLAMTSERSLAERDDVESILWFLGATGHFAAERRVLERAREVDARIIARREEWDPRIEPPTPWLERMVLVDATPWWLDRASLHRLRKHVDGKRLLWPAQESRTLRLRRPPKFEEPDVIGQEDAAARGIVVARMFDGEVEVLIVEAPFGVHVRANEKIDDAKLAGRSGFATSAGLWLPIPDALDGTTELVITYRGATESLPIEF